MCAWHPSGMTQKRKKTGKNYFVPRRRCPRDEWTIDAALGHPKLVNILQTPQFSHGGFLNESVKDTVQMCLCRWFTKCPVIVSPDPNREPDCLLLLFPGWDC